MARLYVAAVLVIAAGAVAAALPASAQCSPSQGAPSICIRNNGTEVDPGDTVYIVNDGANFPMPPLSLTIVGTVGTSLCPCTQVEWNVSVRYVDPDVEDGTSLSASTPEMSNTVQNGASTNWEWDLSSTWPGGHDLGGQVTVSALLESNNRTGFPQPNTVTFTIAGYQLPLASRQTLAHSFLSTESAPWFMYQILEWESTFEQFTSAGLPYFSPDTTCTKNGEIVSGKDSEDVGTGQVNSCQQAADFANEAIIDPVWNYQTNIDDALGWADAAMGPAYTFWDNQVSQMCTAQGGVFSGVIGSGQTTCTLVADAPATDFPYCVFGLAPGQPSSFRDAEWIKGYNYGKPYFISWDQASLPQGWYALNDSPNNYVTHVCGSQPY